jgi:hypothetical protein
MNEPVAGVFRADVQPVQSIHPERFDTRLATVSIVERGNQR